jgi:S-formylglutathione hydrolase FrmB
LRALLAGSLLAIGLLGVAGDAQAMPALTGAAGLQVSGPRQLDPRLIEATLTTDALPGPAHVRILLPAGYESEPTRRYPVLYLLHGTSGSASDWTRDASTEQSTAGLGLIVVMPDVALNRDGGGWCTNWANRGAHGLPEWERFHIGQLIPWADQNLRTIPARRGRAIAGLSQGGFCALSYAVRHPDLFSSVLSYSGVTDIAYGPAALARGVGALNAVEAGLDHVAPNSIFGDPGTAEINWATHDPATMAGNLRGMNVGLYWGNGERGPLDPARPDRGAMALEARINEDNLEFRSRMQTLGVNARFDAYGPGTHSWPYWNRDLRESVGPLMAAFADPPAPATRVTYTTAEGRYAVYGWTVAIHRTAEEFSWLHVAGTRRFGLAGSGWGSVLTPPSYVPGARYRLLMRARAGVRRATAVADATGRLHVRVPLGPPNPYQQGTAQAVAAGTAVYTTSVSISRARA